jgi:hypothetical protein
MSDEFTLDPVHVSCRGCVFAQYATNPENHKPSQTGCALGKLDRFRMYAETSVVPAEDHDTEFYLVNGRHCHFYRDRASAWAKAVPAEAWAAKARTEVVMRVDAVIVLQDQENDPEQLLALLGKTLDSLRSQYLKPVSVHVVSNQDQVKLARIHAFLLKEGHDLNWSLTGMLVRNNDGSRRGRNDAIDEVFGKLAGHYYVVIAPGFELPPAFILDLDRAVNDDMARFVVCLPASGSNGLVVQNGFHKRHDGNRPGYGEENGEQVMLRDVAAKAAYFARAHDCPHLVARS